MTGRLDVTIEAGADRIDGTSPIDIMVVGRTGGAETHVKAALVLTGGLDGWAPVDITGSVAKPTPPPRRFFPLGLAAGEQHRCTLRLQGLFFGAMASSGYPQQPWRAFQRTLDPANDEVSLQLVVAYTGDNGDRVNAVSNTICRRVRRRDTGGHDTILRSLERLDRVVNDVRSRLGPLELAVLGDGEAALAAAEAWKRGDADHVLDQAGKADLVRQLLMPDPSGVELQAVLDILRGSTDYEVAHVVATIGEHRLLRHYQGEPYREIVQLLAARRDGMATAKPETPSTFAAEKVVEVSHLFRANALSPDRLNCILIVRDAAPRLFSTRALGLRVRRALAELRGPTLKMTEVRRVLIEMRLGGGGQRIKFDNGNGLREPSRMEVSAWDEVMKLTGATEGWNVFGLAVFDGYHSAIVFVDKRPDGPKVYWADQWRIDPGDDFLQEPGSVSGFRRYEKAGFDRFITEKTIEWWKREAAKGNRFKTTLHVWRFRSALKPPPRRSKPGS